MGLRLTSTSAPPTKVAMLSGLRLASFLILALGCRSQEHKLELSTPKESRPQSPSTQAPAGVVAASATAAPPTTPARARNHERDGSAPDGDTEVRSEVHARGSAGANKTRRAYRIAALGDSLTDPRSHGGGYLEYIKQHCPKSRVENLGVGGYMVNQIRTRFEKLLLPRLPGDFTHLIVWGGVNDLYSDQTAGRSVEKIQRDLEFIYRAGKDRGLAVIAIAVAPWAGFSRYFTPHRGQNTIELNRWILDENPNVDVAVDAYALLSCGDPERLCPKYQPRHRDGLHLGPVGHERLGRALLEAAFSECL